MIAVFPGSFCPPTAGHINIIERASRLFDKLYVVIGVNSEKKYDISVGDRQNLLKKATELLKNVQVVSYDGFTTDFCNSVNADVLIKSARNAVDFQEIADIEKVTKNCWKGETVIFIADKQCENISSSIVRDFVKHGKDIGHLVDSSIKDDIVSLLKKGK